MASRRVWLVLAGLVLALACYYLPWFTHSTAGFTMNGFDLAEWSSLHPAVRSTSMLTSFLLRAPLLAVIAALALIANRLPDPRARWVLRALVVLIALRFIPPADFFRAAREDPNYRQMALFTVLSGIAIVAALTLYRVPGRWQAALLVLLLLAGTAAGWWGLARAKLLLDNFEIAVKVGPGFIGYAALAAATTVWTGLGWRNTNKKGG
jgi:uncharacterized membrane protein